MYYFTSDYTEGCHPKVLEKLIATNMEQSAGYGLDEHSENARNLIKKACQREDIDVHFLMGGTQTNLIVISSILRPHQAVFGAVPSHINTHEAGAIERTGHKVLTISSPNGKLTAKQIEEKYAEYDTDPNREHLAQPKMVYISQPTEIGSLYYKEELEELYKTCKKHGLYLFIDGARLGYALASSDNDITLKDLAQLCDVFYIGGTKCGSLLGEAVVLVNDKFKEDFRTITKGAGGILAKGRVLGVQFEALFTDNLYTKICRHGIEMAMLVKEAIWEKGLPVVTDSPTNQQFPIMPNKMLEELSKKYALAPWEIIDKDSTAVRICTSWATDETQLRALLEDLRNF